VRILIRTSKWAIWARRLGSLAVPLVVLPVLMHRERIIESPGFLVAMAFAAVVGVLAVLVGLVALARLWHTGDIGWGRAIAGLLLGLACLAPFFWYGHLALSNPLATDIATIDRGELPLIFEPGMTDLPPPRLLTVQQRQRFFPNATTRTYPLDPAQLFVLVERLVAAQGWDVRLRREPGLAGEPGRINARIVTLLGWREEAVLRVAPIAGGSAVDMRSVSLAAPSDFGANGRRISDFLVALDNEVTAFLRDNPTLIGTPESDEPSPEVDVGNGD